MSALSPLAWGQYFYDRSRSTLPGTDHALYRMTDLIKRGALDQKMARAVLHDSLLMDMVWRVTWADDDGLPDRPRVPAAGCGRSRVAERRTHVG